MDLKKVLLSFGDWLEIKLISGAQKAKFGKFLDYNRGAKYTIVE